MRRAGVVVMLSALLLAGPTHAAAAQPEPIDPPIGIPRPQPVPAVLEGTVARIDMRSSPARLHVWTNGVISSVDVTPETSIFVAETSTGRGGAAGLDRIRRGDMVRITLDEHLRATLIVASYREVRGRLDRITVRIIRLAGGQAFRLADEPLFLMGDRAVPRQALRRGAAVTLRVHPKTGEVWEVRAHPAVTP